VTNIKRQLFVEDCGVVSDECDSHLDDKDLCSTPHCLKTYKEWDVSDELHALWFYILQAHDSEDGAVDYDGCLEALGFEESPGTKTEGD